MRRVLMLMPAWLRVVLRRVLVTLFRGAGALGLPRIARGKVSTRGGSTGPVEQALGATASCSVTTDAMEHPPAPDLVFQHGPDIRPRPLRTVHLLVDTSDPRYSFRNNVVVDHRRRVIAEERTPWAELPVSFSLLEPAERRPGTVAYLSNTNVGNFYHWILLTLPLVGLYRDRLDAEPDAYYVGRPVTAWHRETLQMLGIAGEQIVSNGVRADRLVAGISNREHGAVDPAWLTFVREELGRPRFASSVGRRLFIGRGEVAFRRFVNEDECFRLLEDEYGFEYVTMDGKTVTEEIELFSSADCVVGVFGAALTNLLWSQPGCKVLELFPYGFNHPGYEELAAFVGCRYGYIVGSQDVPRAAGLDKPDAVRRENDLRVPPATLKAAAEALGF